MCALTMKAGNKGQSTMMTSLKWLHKCMRFAVIRLLDITSNT